MALWRFFYALVRIPPIFLLLLNEKRSQNRLRLSLGGSGGIRTPVGLHPNGFQDRLVMTTSIHFHDVFIFCYSIITLFLKFEYSLNHFFKKLYIISPSIYFYRLLIALLIFITLNGYVRFGFTNVHVVSFR